MSEQATYGFLKDKYYKIQQKGLIVIPEGADYKTSAIETQIMDSIDQAEVNIFRYKSDLITECNSERVAFMKQFLTEEKVKEIEEVNEDYFISVEYELFNKEGKIIKSGTSSIQAKYSNAAILSDINEDNSLEYRKGFVFDGRIEIPIPEISRYGIRNSFVQNPYILRIKEIGVYTTIGDSNFIKESSTQVDFGHRKPHSHAHYEHYHHCHRPDDLHFNNFASHFLTNAKMGTTIIDQMVVPAELTINNEYEIVQMCAIPCNGNEYTVNINHKLNLIVLNIEVFLDNFLTVYDIADINGVLELNKVPVPDVEEPDMSEDEKEPVPDTGNEETPDNTEPDEGKEETTTPEENTNI